MRSYTKRKLEREERRGRGAGAYQQRKLVGGGPDGEEGRRSLPAVARTERRGGGACRRRPGQRGGAATVWTCGGVTPPISNHVPFIQTLYMIEIRVPRWKYHSTTLQIKIIQAALLQARGPRGLEYISLIIQS